MGLLTSNVSRLRNDPRLLRLPPYVALLCILGGIAWMFLLPLNEYSRRTYISENALLPGQVHTYFHGSEQNIYRAYQHEITSVLEPKAVLDDNGQPTGGYLVATDGHRNEKIERILQDAGLKTARQKYKFESAGRKFVGENVYTVVHGPRADGTESIVLIAPVRNARDEVNIKGVTLLLTLARYFSRWSLWSKDIILLVTPDASAGPQAFVDAYHSMHDSSTVDDLSLKTGHIQGALVIDFPLDHNFETLHVEYDGVNGQLPNLDLINTAIQIVSGQMGIGSTIQSQHYWAPPDEHAKYIVRLKTLCHGMINQALGHATGAHSVFMPYHIDAITLTAVGRGWQDEMAFGRSVESIVRSLNNLLEKLHQSFFFYLMLENIRFVSIGTYLPSAMAVGASFTIIAIFGWVMSGYEEVEIDAIKSIHTASSTEDIQDDKQALVEQDEPERKRTTTWRTVDRPLLLPVAVVAALHLTSILSISLLANIRVENLVTTATIRSVLILITPIFIAMILKQYTSVSAPTLSKQTKTVSSTTSTSTSSPAASTNQLYTLLSSLSLLILGLELTVLATLNFSLSMVIGVLCAPLAFTGYVPVSSSTSTSLAKSSESSKSTQLIQSLISLVTLLIFSPPIVTLIATALDLYYYETFRAPVGMIGRIREFLEEEAFAYNVLGAWAVNFGVWAIWVPAWIVASTGVWASLISSSGGSGGSSGSRGSRQTGKEAVTTTSGTSINQRESKVESTSASAIATGKQQQQQQQTSKEGKLRKR